MSMHASFCSPLKYIPMSRIFFFLVKKVSVKNYDGGVCRRLTIAALNSKGAVSDCTFRICTSPCRLVALLALRINTPSNGEFVRMKNKWKSFTSRYLSRLVNGSLVPTQTPIRYGQVVMSRPRESSYLKRPHLHYPI